MPLFLFLSKQPLFSVVSLSCFLLFLLFSFFVVSFARLSTFSFKIFIGLPLSHLSPLPLYPATGSFSAGCLLKTSFSSAIRAGNPTTFTAPFSAKCNNFTCSPTSGPLIRPVKANRIG